MKIIHITPETGAGRIFDNMRIATFLHEHLDEFGDKMDDILKCLGYVFADGRGGHIVLGTEDENIIGAVVLNNTGMGGYIPENILVYIALHRDHRGKGLGKALMQEALNAVNGDVALHVEPDNPAKHLYEKLGFTNKYLEMRWKRGATA